MPLSDLTSQLLPVQIMYRKTPVTFLLTPFETGSAGDIMALMKALQAVAPKILDGTEGMLPAPDDSDEAKARAEKVGAENKAIYENITRMVCAQVRECVMPNEEPAPIRLVLEGEETAGTLRISRFPQLITAAFTRLVEDYIEDAKAAANFLG